ncbi:hypothetical protein ACF0H5_001354 [Mactra antiquata]
MSWDQFFDQSGDYVGGNEQVYQDDYYTDFQQQKRPYEEQSFDSKRMKTEYGDYGGSDNQASGDIDWTKLSEITSWDQLGSGGASQKRGGGGHGGKGGDGRGAKGGRGGRGGKFGGGGGGGGFSGQSYGTTGGSEQGDGQFVGGTPSSLLNMQVGFGGGRGGKGRGGGQQNYGGSNTYASRGGGNKSFGGGQSFGSGWGGSGGRGGGSARGGSRGAGGFKSRIGVLRPESATMSLVQKFEKLGNFLRGDVMRSNAIQSIENACVTLGLAMKTDYTSDEFPRIHNRLIFSGALRINGIFLARGVGVNKKELKHEVYNTALEILKTKSVKDINELKDPGPETVRICIERILKETRPKYQEGIGVPTNQTTTDVVAKIQGSLNSVLQLQIGLGKLLAYMKGPQKMPDNAIAKLEQSMIASKCGLRHMFQVQTPADSEIPVYNGEFILEDTCIARASDSNRKTCKTETYIAAWDALTTKQVTDLVIPVSKDEETLNDDDEHEKNEAIVSGDQHDGEMPPAVVKPSLREASLTERFKNLFNVLSVCAYSEQLVNQVDNCIFNSGLNSTCIYKKSDYGCTYPTSCEFFVENYFIALGLGNTKVECMNGAYSMAYDVLTTHSPDDILINCRKMQENETVGPLIFDVVVKGERGQSRESNIALLHRHGFQADDESKNISDLVIVETKIWQTNRKLNAFAILQKTAALNGMLLQWVFLPGEPSKKHYKYEHRPVSKVGCQLFLKNKKVSEHFGYGKNKTRDFAASDILFHLYERNDTVMIVRTADDQKWIPFSTIESEANIMRKAANQPASNGQGKRQADMYIVKCVQKRMTEFFPRNDCEELIIGPGLQSLELLEVQKYAESIHVLMEKRQNNCKTYCVFYSQPDMRQVVAALKSMPPKSTYGRFKLIPKLELPKHSDINKSSSVPAHVLSQSTATIVKD